MNTQRLNTIKRMYGLENLDNNNYEDITYTNENNQQVEERIVGWYIDGYPTIIDIQKKCDNYDIINIYDNDNDDF